MQGWLQFLDSDSQTLMFLKLSKGQSANCQPAFRAVFRDAPGRPTSLQPRCSFETCPLWVRESQVNFAHKCRSPVWAVLNHLWRRLLPVFCKMLVKLCKIHAAFVVCILRLYQSSCEFQDWRTDISLAWDRSCGLGLTCFEAASIASRLGSILWVEVSIVRTAPKYVAAVKARVFCPSDSIRV